MKALEVLKKGRVKYLIYIGIVLIATGISLGFALWGDKFSETVNAFKNVDPLYICLIILIVFASYAFDGLIIYIFCRLYTRRYRWHQGCATTLIGQFYSDITPGATGGQIMEVFTLRKQGMKVANAASIMVMWFIMYQTSLIIFDIIALCVEWQTIITSKPLFIGGLNWEIPLLPLIIIGFALNLSVIAILYMMSFSSRFHNWIIKYGLGFLAKIKLVKNLEEQREKVRIHALNFKNELKRLQTNFPVIIVTFIVFMVMLFARFSIPYFAGLSLNAWGDKSFSAVLLFRSAFLSATHQMVTGLIPLPGSAGVSEMCFEYLFYNYFYYGPDGVTPSALVSSLEPSKVGGVMEGIMSSTQILWRTATFHIVLLVTGIVAAFYHGRPSKSMEYANRKTFVDLQYETYQHDDLNKTELDLVENTQILQNPVKIKRRKKVEKVEKPKEVKKEKIEDNTKWDDFNI